MFLSKGTIGLSLAALAASAGTVSASADDGLFTDPLMFSYEPYDAGSTKTILVSYRDDSGHKNIVNHTKKMKGEGKQVKEKNHRLKKAHTLKGAPGSSGDKKGKPKKDRRLRWLQEDQAIMAGFSVLELETDDLKAEIAAISAIEGVTAVEQDGMMHIMSTEYEQKIRGGGGVAEHIREIQDAISTTADELPEVDAEAHHGRRLAEETPYGIDMVNASYVWPKTPVMTEPIKICVVDTGYDLGHEDLPESDGIAGFNNYGQSWSDDGNGHGTHCAGTIGAIGGNSIGVTSVNPDPSKFTFYIGKGLSNSGSGTTVGVMDAVKACVDAGAKVISLSLGGGGYSAIDNAFYEAIYDEDGELTSIAYISRPTWPHLTNINSHKLSLSLALLHLLVLIVAAAGNYAAEEAFGYPASYPSVMSVASVDSLGFRSSFSQWNTQVEISAPGSAVKSTIPDDKYDTKSGTSMVSVLN